MTLTNFLLCLCLIVPNLSRAAEGAVTKSQFVESVKTAIPNAFCTEKQVFRKCFKVTEDECLGEAMRATKVCILSVEDQIPPTLHQPADGAAWGKKIGACAGRNYFVSLAKSKINSPECDNPNKYGQGK